LGFNSAATNAYHKATGVKRVKLKWMPRFDGSFNCCESIPQNHMMRSIDRSVPSPKSNYGCREASMASKIVASQLRKKIKTKEASIAASRARKATGC